MKLNLFKLMRISGFKGGLEIGDLFQVILFNVLLLLKNIH